MECSVSLVATMSLLTQFCLTLNDYSCPEQDVKRLQLGMVTKQMAARSVEKQEEKNTEIERCVHERESERRGKRKIKTEREREVQDFPGPRKRTVFTCTYTKSVTGGHVIMLLTIVEVVRLPNQSISYGRP